jgi:hypothetical protein
VADPTDAPLQDTHEHEEDDHAEWHAEEPEKKGHIALLR